MLIKYFTRGDIALIAGLLVLSVASIAGVRYYTANGKHAVVEVNGRRVLELSLDKNVTHTVTGPLGETVIVIEDGSVRIADSPCPHHYCIRMGRLRRRGEIAVCVPNRVVVTITGGSEDESFDGITR